MAKATRTSVVPAHAVVTKNVSTRLNKSAPKVATAITVAFDDPAIEREFAVRGAVIAMQAVWRNAGNIPTACNVTLTDVKRLSGEIRRAPATPDSIARTIESLSDAERIELLRRIGAAVPQRKRA